MISCTDSVTKVSGIADKMAKVLKKLGIESFFDLLMHVPVDYEDRTRVIDVNRMHAGDYVTVRVNIELLQSRRSHRRRMVICEAMCSDITGQVRVVWFGNRFIMKTLKVGEEVFLYGKVYEDQYGLQLRSPEYEKVKKENVHVGRIVPRYRLTRGVTQKQLRFFVSNALEVCEVNDWLPDVIRQRNGLLSLHDAFRSIHFPRDKKQMRMAQRRLKFDEFFLLQMRGLITRQELQSQTAHKIEFGEEIMRRLVKNLPFRLTDDQKKASWQVLCDMARTYPMNRLLQGDVGSGKTMVAAMSLYQAAADGYVGMLMVPTDILAQQHFETLLNVFGGGNVGLFTRTTRKIGDSDVLTKKQFRDRLNEVQILIGTHALLFDDVEIEKLGLVVVDEQHRFGVKQRRAIKDRTHADVMPHFLSMTATPIPRSAALVLYGELDVSVIQEKPAGRKSIVTKLVSERGRAKAYEFVQNQLNRDRQVFVVCPMIKDSDELDVASVERVFERLSKSVFVNREVAMLHGKMKQKEKDAIMARMVSGDIDVLVSTSVIEVGVDVPNATVMMIEGAERFGLAQLHQFRGRIGRAEHQSYCFVFPTHINGDAMQRLRIFESENDGFRLAQHDLEMRGPGDMYGTVQSGFPDLKLATLKDVDIIEIAQREAQDVMRIDEDKTRYPELWGRIKDVVEDVHLE